MKHIKTKLLASFRRCGVVHTRTGATFTQSQFTPAEWKILEAESQLVVTPVDVAPVTPQDVSDALEARVRTAIMALGAGDFGKTGAPSIGAIREAIGEEGASVTPALRDAVWSILKDEGFTAPEVPEETPPAVLTEVPPEVPPEA